MNKLFIPLILLALIGVTAFIFRDRLTRLAFSPTAPTATPGLSQETLSSPTSFPQNGEPVETLAQNLDIPWAIAFLPTNDMLVSERPGTLVKVSPQKDPVTIRQIQGVEHVGEGGLLGVTLHPNFEVNSWVYLYLTTASEDGLINRVERYTFENDQLSERTSILDNIPGANYHDGGRIAFGPDNLLYISTGDAGEPQEAQDTTTLNGKILRVNDDGSIPADNPFGNEVYSYGHRNPQGLAWDQQGRLWITEHGPSGAQSGCDEINLIQKGGNYGWPTVRCEQTAQGTIAPALQSGRDDTWAPAGAVIRGDSLFFAGLRGSSLYQLKLEDEQATNLTAHFTNEFGRLRALVQGPDGQLYLTTSNTDGRGTPRQTDDKIIRLDPSIF